VLLAEFLTFTAGRRGGEPQGEWQNFWAVANGENFGKTFGATHRGAAKMSKVLHCAGDIITMLKGHFWAVSILASNDHYLSFS
jgi:hypothetical protein